VNFCSDTLFFEDTVNITNSILPIASFHTSQQTYCPGSTVNFVGDGAYGTIKNYLWNFGDGTTDTLSSPLHAYSSPGIYPVSLIVENNCNNKDTLVSLLVIDTTSIPNADFAVSPGLHSCVNSILTFQNLSSDSNVSWDFGDGNSSTTVDPIHVYYVPGNYMVKITVTNNCGKLSISSKLLRVSARYEPVASITLQDSIFCRDQIIYFESEPSSVAVSYLWSFGDGTQSNLQNPTKAYSNSGLFTVIQTVSNECGTRSDSIKIKINDSLSNSPLFLTCMEQSGELILTWNAIQGAVNYEMTFDNGDSWIVTGSTNTFILSGLNIGDSISTKIRAVGACQNSIPSAESSCTLTMLSEKYKNMFAVYPNPFTQNIHLDLVENISGTKINLTTVLGESLYSVEVAEEQKKIILDLDFLPAGIYLIEMTNYNSIIPSILKKIIKL
jgi:PKD repeat protein